MPVIAGCDEHEESGSWTGAGTTNRALHDILGWTKDIGDLRSCGERLSPPGTA